MIFEWFSAAGLASCGVGDDASFGRRSSLGDAFLGVPEDAFLGVPGDALVGVPGDVRGEDLSPADLMRRLLGGRGEVGDLGERLFATPPPSVASGEGVLDARPSATVRPSVSGASCLLGVVASGDLANPCRTARGVTTDEGDVTWRTRVGVEGGGWGCGISISLAFESPRS